jgi:hypothetical protein
MLQAGRLDDVVATPAVDGHRLGGNTEPILHQLEEPIGEGGQVILP